MKSRTSTSKGVGKRLFAILLSLCMLAGLIPAAALTAVADALPTYTVPKYPDDGSLHTRTAHFVTYSTMNIVNATGAEFDENGTTLTIRDGQYISGYGQVMILKAEDIWPDQPANTVPSFQTAPKDHYMNLRVENDDGEKLSVYLVDFGTTTESERFSGVMHPTKGLRSITIVGDNVSVYLVNSNIGYIEFKMGESTQYFQTDFINYAAYAIHYDEMNGKSVLANAQIIVDGFNSHVYMGAETNAMRPANDPIVCRVGVNCPVSEFTEGGAYFTNGNHYDPYHDYIANQYNNKIGTRDECASSVELQNVWVTKLGSSHPSGSNAPGVYGDSITNGSLEGLTRVSITNGSWYAPEEIELHHFAGLSLSGADTVRYVQHTEPAADPEGTATTTYVRETFGPAIELNELSRLDLEGKSDLSIHATGDNRLRLNNAQLSGNILVSNGNTALSQEGYYDSAMIWNLNHSGRTGGILKLFLGGDSTQITPNRSNNHTPNIMVDNLASLVVKDDPDQTGIGSLSVGQKNYDGGNWYNAAIGGTPSLDPKPHGLVSVQSGILNAWSNNGSAAIGGSIQQPYIVYDEQGQIDLDNSIVGFSLDGGAVEVTGGVVNAYAIAGGAAIGGACGGNGGSFGLNGGTVNATTSGFDTSSGVTAAAVGGGAAQYKQSEYAWLGYLEPPTSSSIGTSIYVRDGYTYKAGGGGGVINIYGGVLNATAENPEYDFAGKKKLGMLDSQNYEFYISSSRDQSGHPIYENLYESDFPQTYYAKDGLTECPWEMIYSNGDGRTHGYVIGNSCMDHTVYANQRNRVEIVTVGGLVKSNGDPFVILRQKSRNGDLNASWNSFYMPHADKDIYDDTTHEPFQPSRIGRAAIFTIGYVDDRVIEGDYPYEVLVSGSERTEIRNTLREYTTYRLHGQVNWPDPESNTELELSLPQGTVISMLSGSVMNVPENVTLSAADTSQFVIGEGNVVQGKGRWPGKPADPQNPPSYSQVKRLVEQMTGTSGVTGVTHLGIGKVKGGYIVIPGNGADEVRARAGGSSVELITILNAGQWGFKKEIIGDDADNNTRWTLLNYEVGKTSVSLIENGALTATAGTYMTAGEWFNVIVQDNNGNVSVTLRSAKLSTPDYTVYEGQAGDLLELNFNPGSSQLAFKIDFDEDQVIQNKAVFSVPTFSGSEFKLTSVAPLKDKCALRYGGSLAFTTPFADFAGLKITELQINYGDKTTLGGIAADSHVETPSIAGFPVKGNAKMKINTFSGKRLFSLNVELETPLFEGAFDVSFKEARGIMMLDTLYAEIGVDGGGIPLVPPTVIGYIQGGGLGITGLADTINMNSIGIPPVRLKIAAKGSIIDVIDAWVRLSVGLDGFDLELSDIKIADAKFIKKFGASAKWYAGNQTIDGNEYWGFGTDMSAYLVVSVMLPGYEDEYGWDENDFDPFALLSATGTVGFGGFTGYYLETQNGKKYAHFIYNLHASAMLNASLSIPKNIVGGFFPPKNVTFGQVQAGFYAAANTKTKMDVSSVTGSPSSVLNQLAKNASISFNAAVGAKVIVGAGKFKGNVRIVYVLGEKGVRVGGGWGSGSALDLSGAVNSTPVVGNEYATLALVEDEDTGDTYPVLVEAGFEKIASLDLHETGTESTENVTAKKKIGAKNTPEIILSSLDTAAVAGESVNAKGGSTAPAGVGVTATVNTSEGRMLAFTLDSAYSNLVLTPDDVTVTLNGNPVTLVAPTYGAQVTQTGYYGQPEDNDSVNFDSGEGIFYFIPSAAGTYTITIIGSPASIDHVDAIAPAAFASLDGNATTVTGSTANYKVDDADEERKYKVQYVLGSEEGKSDYVLAERELTGQSAYNGSMTFSLEGSLAPTGTYHPSVLLLEYVTATGENGDSIETWSLVEQKTFSSVSYTNTEIPAGPASADLSYSGNGSMTATWSAVANADYYQISVFEYSKKGDEPAVYTDTGLLFKADGQATSVVMDLSSLDAGKQYSVSVKAVIVTDVESETFKTSTASPYSAPVTQRTPEPPVIAFSDNVLAGEENTHSFTAGADGGTIQIMDIDDLTVTVLNADYDPATGIITVPAMTKNEPMTIRVLALNETTKDYALEYINVIYDDTPPLLTLNGLGEFVLEKTENGYVANIAGQTEAGASVYVYNDNGDFLAGSASADDGSFVVPMQFAVDPENTCLYVFAADKAGNKSDGMAVSFKESDVAVRLDFNGIGAVCASDSMHLKAGGTAGTLPVPLSTDGGYLFDGWYTESEGGTQVTALTIFDKNTTIYAHWSECVIVTIIEDDQELSAFAVRKGSPIGTLPEPSIKKDNKICTGWERVRNQGGNEPVGEDFVPTANLTIIPVWSTYSTVKFDAGVGMCDVYEIKVPTDGTIASYPVPEATGYAFGGWTYTNGSGAEVTVDGSTVYSADLTLTAKWIRNVSPLFVTQASYEATGDPDEVLPDPAFSKPVSTTGQPSVTYIGTGSTNYLSAAKPTKAGTYKVTVQCNTAESAYIGSATFTVRDGNAATYAVTVNAPSNGTVSASLASAAAGETVKLTLNPAAGYKNGTVTVQSGSTTIAVTAAGSSAYTFVMPAAAVEVSATFEALAEPAFNNLQAILTGEIGMRFYMNFPDGFDPTGAYMDFVLSDGRTGSMTYAESAVNETGRYFTCYMNALELSETITATFHYGSGQTISMTYAASDYLSYLSDHAQEFEGTPEKQEELFRVTNALLNYGYYLQRSGWTDGTDDHEAIDSTDTGAATRLDTVKEATEPAKATKDMGTSGIPDENVFFSLTLNEDTVINLYILKSDAYTITSATLDNAAHVPEEVNIDGVDYILIHTDSIGASGLMTNHTAVLTTESGTATITFSAISYVWSILNSSLPDNNKQAIVAFYDYAVAAHAYYN